MARQTEQLEREAEETRRRLAGTLGELRIRLTPGHVVDQVVDYAREGPAADFLGNLAREVRENPVPVLLILAGILWLSIASSRSPRTIVAFDNDTRITPPPEPGPAIAGPVEWWPEQPSHELTPAGA